MMHIESKIVIQLKFFAWIIYAFLSMIYIAMACNALADSCPPGTLFNPYKNGCYQIIDIRNRNSDFKTYSLFDEKPPIPGGRGAGITYKNGRLQALEHAELHTKMFVHPDGLNPSGPLNWLYTTATNRTNRSIEVVGIYAGWKEFGYLGIWDWSCITDYPCPDGSISAGFQWSVPFSEFECNMEEIVDKGGHYQTIIHYTNISKKIDSEDPPLWLHEVLLWNFCDESWDLIYEHESRYNKLDCSLENNSCAFWGPILETFGDDPYPAINELGFEDTLLFHDGTWSELAPDDTDFTIPILPWDLFHLEPNRGYGAGNYVAFAPPVADFTANPNRGVKPLTVDFADESQWAITDWLWDFGDGGISSEENPIHIFDNPGVYTVSLTVTGPGGTNTATMIDYIMVEYEPPVANFTADNTSGVIPHSVNFTDASSGDITDWLWDFGDGNTSVEQSPQHTYIINGIYDVSLSISGPNGNDTIVKISYITITESKSDKNGDGSGWGCFVGALRY